MNIGLIALFIVLFILLGRFALKRTILSGERFRAERYERLRREGKVITLPELIDLNGRITTVIHVRLPPFEDEVWGLNEKVIPTTQILNEQFLKHGKFENGFLILPSPTSDEITQFCDTNKCRVETICGEIVLE